MKASIAYHLQKKNLFYMHSFTGKEFKTRNDWKKITFSVLVSWLVKLIN